MVESAHKYLKATNILYRLDPNLLHIISVNAALGLEILLRSFIAKVAKNEGELNEKYKLNWKALYDSHALLLEKGDADEKMNLHDLVVLYHAIPDEVRKAVNLHRFEIPIRTCRHVSARRRYEHEAKSPVGFCDTAIQALNTLVPNTVHYYKQQGCTDSWIISHPDVP